MSVTITSRAEWGSVWPEQGGASVAPPARKGVILHHSVTAEGTDRASVGAILRAIERLDRDTNKWSGSYNYAIDHAGTVYELTGLSRVGTHAANNNTPYWGICYIGDGRSGYPEAAAAATRELMSWLSIQAGHPLVVRGHQQVNNTACPGGLIQARINAGYFGSGITADPTDALAVDGILGHDTIRALQRQLAKTGHYNGPADGVIDAGRSATVMGLQTFLNSHGAEPALIVDGAGFSQGPQKSKTNAVLQRHLGTVEDGRFDLPISIGIKVLQVRLNAGAL